MPFLLGLVGYIVMLFLIVVVVLLAIFIGALIFGLILVGLDNYKEKRTAPILSIKWQLERANSGYDLMLIAKKLFEKGGNLTGNENSVFRQKALQMWNQFTDDDWRTIYTIAEVGSRLKKEAYKRSLKTGA